MLYLPTTPLTTNGSSDTSFAQSPLDELHDSLPHIEAVPGFLHRQSLHTPGQAAVPLARVLHHCYIHSFLPQRPVHLLALTQRIRDVAVALNEQERRPGVGRISERTLTPGVLEVHPGLAVPPAVVPRAVLGTVLADLIDHRRAADDRLEAISLAGDEARHFTAIAVAHQHQFVGIDRLRRDHGIHARHDVAVIPAAEIVLVGRNERHAVSGAAARIGT